VKENKESSKISYFTLKKIHNKEIKKERNKLLARHVLKLAPLGYYSRHPCAWTSATLPCIEISSFIQANLQN
jgi:hypothetical protein